MGTPGIGQGTKGHPSRCYPHPHATSQRPVLPWGQESPELPWSLRLAKGRTWTCEIWPPMYATQKALQTKKQSFKSIYSETY